MSVSFPLLRKMETLMLRLKFLVAALAIGTSTAVLTARNASAASNSPGECGEYMYWHNGACVDARDRSSSSWGDSMSNKKAQW
jgi:hypothetical protein